MATARTKVAGIDLGPSLSNDPTGLQIAEFVEDGYWLVTRNRDHRIRRSDESQCNQALLNAIQGCSVVVIEAPLLLRSEKPWERTLIECPDLSDSMKPSYTWAILSHAWRAQAIANEFKRQENSPRLIEIFPAAWFWLCEFGDSVEWKGKDTFRQRKRNWFCSRCERIKELFGIQIHYGDEFANHDETDALPCVLCAILVAESIRVVRLDSTEPHVLFPPDALWDSRLPSTIREFDWFQRGQSAIET